MKDLSSIRHSERPSGALMAAPHGPLEACNQRWLEASSTEPLEFVEASNSRDWSSGARMH